MDDYVILAFIGEGSFGRVFKAKNKKTGETVALKVIRKKGRSPKDLKNLRQECDIQRKLDHPNIIRMIDSFDTETELVVVTEFAEKELHSVLAKEGCLGEDQAKKITWDLVSALYYLHSHRVLHRDLKPQNVLIDSSGKAKLCDFGLARNMTNSTHVLTSIKGTPLYMAPELIDEKPYDHQADLWSLGCIVYELMAGQPPFCTMSIMQLVRMIRHKPVQWPSFISVEAFSFLQGLLHKDPSKRMTWPEILKHPFVSDHVLIIPEDVQSDSPFTQPLTHSQLEAKQLQTQQLNTLRPNMQANPANKKTLQGQTIPSECVPLSDDDSIRATSAFSVRDSLKTDDEDIGQPISAAHAKLLTHEYKVINNSNLVVYNLNTNMAQLLKQDQQNKMEKITEENEKPDSRKQSLQSKKEDSKQEVEIQHTEYVENKVTKKLTVEPATQSFENPKSSSKSGSDISSGLSKSVPPSYKQKILQFSKDKLRFSSGNRLTRSLRRSFRFSRSWDKNKGESQRRTSEPSREIIDKIEDLSCFSKEDKDKDIEKCEIIDETSNESDIVMLSNNLKSQSVHNDLEKVEDKQPSAIEQEEWEAFLNSNIAEVMDGDVECLTQPNMVSMVVGVVAGAGKGGGRLCGTVAALLALPAVSPHLPRHTLLHIIDVYLEAKVVSNFVFAVNVLMKDVKPSDLSTEERLGGVSRMLEVCVWACGKSCRAVRQFAAAIQAHGTHAVFATLLSMCNESPRTVLNIISLLIMILQDLPEYADVVERILFEDHQVNVLKLLKQPSDALRMRVCILISLLCSFCCTALSSAMERTWSRSDKECLEALSSHCNVGLNRAAKLANKELSNMPFYSNN